MLIPIENVKIEDLGVREEFVYDLETETHDYFANNILVHNSNYYSVEPVVKKWLGENPNATFEEICDFCLDFETKHIVPTIQRCIDDFAEQFNAPNKWAMGAKREVLCDCVAGDTVIHWSEDGIARNGKISDLILGSQTDILDLTNRNIKTPSFNPETGAIELRQIRNVQRKSTTRAMVEVSFPGLSSITCTEDHLFAVRKNGGTRWVSAKDLTPECSVVTINGVLTGGMVKPAENQEFVFDLEIEGTHNFFGNGLCVHNCVIMVAKKRYTARVIDDEGVRLTRQAAHIKVQGLDLVRSTTPKWCKKRLKEAIPMLFDLGEADLIKWLDDIKTEFTAQPLGDISVSQGLSSLDYKLGEKGIPLNARSALIYNKYIKDAHLDDRFGYIQAGDKPKRIFLRPDNPWGSDSISWLNDAFTEQIREWIDWDTSFEKFFLKPLELMTRALGYDIDKRTCDLEEW